VTRIRFAPDYPESELYPDGLCSLSIYQLPDLGRELGVLQEWEGLAGVEQ